MTRRFAALAMLLAATVLCAAPPREIWERYTVAFIGGDGENPAYGAARAGAEEAARKLEHQFKLDISILTLTPSSRSGEGQAKALHRAFIEGADGVLLGVSEPGVAAPEIDFLARQGIPTVTFGRDAPGSARIASVLSDNEAIGRAAFEQAAQRLGARGGDIVVLAGDPDDDAAQARLKGLREAAASRPDIRLEAVLACGEDIDSALRAIREAAAADRDEVIDGWIFLGGWPLQGVAAMPWQPGETVCVSVDALPPMLAYLGRGEVDALVAQQYYRWGYQAMDTLVKSIHRKEKPAEEVMQTDYEVISRGNLTEYGESWSDWMQ